MEKKEIARQLLKDKGLRTTAPRLAVLRQLLDADGPLSHTEILGRMGENDWDPATIYRNLVKLRDSGLIAVVSRAKGIDRYAMTGDQEDHHQHPHFVCDDCGKVACLPADIKIAGSPQGAWAVAVENAVIQLRGECPDCIGNSRPNPL